MRARFLALVEKRDLIRPGDRVLVALSGGVDSVVLLHLLRTVAGELGIELRAAHFDHAMRADSAADADWVAGLCRAWDVPLMRERAARPLYGEADARNERYRFLHDALIESGATRMATAHHADDQVETVIFRLLRGTGLRGLAGIPLRRGKLIRPLLRFRKAELIAYATQHQLGFRNDPTNEQLAFARNRIRKHIIPALETVRPNASEAVLALARFSARTEAAISAALARLEKDLIVARSSTKIQLARSVLLEYDAELRALVMRGLLRRFGVVPTRAETHRIVQFCERTESGTSLTVGNRVRIERAFDLILIERHRARRHDDAAVAITADSGRAKLQLGGAHYDVEWQTSDVRALGAEHFDTALREDGLELRGWRAGDRIRLPYGSKKLKKLFAEQRIPVSQRTQIPVLADNSGRVLWVVGVARAADAPAPGPGPALNLTVSHAEQP
jgi:tRNA(Ile)-lysidine synthase